MKVIITGATGLVGSAVIRQCISNTKITHAYVLTRKPLPEAVASHSKITVVTHEDFSSYPTELLEKLAGAEGCLWAIGGQVKHFADLETYKRVQVDYTLAAARAFVAGFGPALEKEGRKFRFVFCSGKFAEWDQSKSLSFMSDTRKVKGLVEKGLCDLADENKDKLEVWCARPSGILPSDAGVLIKATGMLYSAIGVDHVAADLVTIALDGYPDRIIENDALLQMPCP